MMKRILSTTALSLLLAACPATTTDTGPKLSAHLTCNFDSFDSDESTTGSKDCGVSSTNDYEITIELDTEDGKQEDDPAPSKAEPTFPAQAAQVTFTVNGAPFSPALTFAPSTEDGSARTQATATIPGASKGQKVVLHAQTQDSRGLKSNPVDLTFPLN